MKKLFLTTAVMLLTTIAAPAKADFGDADFPVGMFDDGPKSYHDAFCRRLKNKCRVRFQGKGMWVEGQGGIKRNQLVKFRYNAEGDGIAHRDYYNYVTYIGKDGRLREALFLFVHTQAQQNFLGELVRWSRQTPDPVPNYRLPASQGPQETHGRDNGLNPYSNPPIQGGSEKTTP